jgi:hypothetical protein
MSGSSSAWPGGPVWLLGLASMIVGFVFQISALRFGPLALVQPVVPSH